MALPRVELKLPKELKDLPSMPLKVHLDHTVPMVPTREHKHLA
jgi:hypothetical protein